MIEAKGIFTAFRSEALRGPVVNQIITDLIRSPVVVADLTDANPNVYWELGVRQSFKHGTITIAQEGTKLPFDISGKETLSYYPSNHIKMEAFRTRFAKTLDDCNANPSLPDSHVLEAISGRGSLFELVQLEQTIRKTDGVVYELARNKRNLERIYEIIKEHKEKKTVATITARFLVSSVELLISNRYLDEGNRLYAIAANYYGILLSYNEYLNFWPMRMEDTDSWFESNEFKVGEVIAQFETAITDARGKLKTKL
jgi:hypothetical protein